MQGAMENLFAHTADYYDLDTRFMPGTDLDLYRELLEIQGSPVLELACGTGRISIPLAESGASVWALDRSPAMLAILKRKRARLSWKVRRRLHPVVGDMASFRLLRRFPLIMIPFRGFQALTEQRRIESCLHHVKRSLAPGGLFVLDLFAPRVGPALTECATDEHIDWVYERPETGELITRTSRRRGVDTERRILHTEVIYYVETPDGTRARRADDFSLRYYQRWEIETLLCSAGFEIIAEYGGYDKRPLQAGSDMVFVVRAHAKGASRRLSIM